MMQLLNKTKNQMIATHVEIADSFMKRLVGLLSKKHLDKQHCMWFGDCRSIHTLGMRFSLDVIFVDKKMVVKKILYNVKPGCFMTNPVWTARSAFEFAAGSLDSHNIQPGDQLDLVH